MVDTEISDSSRLLSPPSSALSLSSPSLRRTDTDSITTPPLVVDEDEADGVSHSSRSDQREPPPDQDEGVTSECGGSACDAGKGLPPPPLCALSVFRAPEMLAFEDYLHRSRRLPTRLGFPTLLPSPDKWHDWSWARLRPPVYAVPKRPEETEAVAGPGPPRPSLGEAHDLSHPLSDTP
jgi:hypothetical protein